MRDKEVFTLIIGVDEVICDQKDPNLVDSVKYDIVTIIDGDHTGCETLENAIKYYEELENYIIKALEKYDYLIVSLNNKDALLKTTNVIFRGENEGEYFVDLAESDFVVYNEVALCGKQ